MNSALIYSFSQKVLKMKPIYIAVALFCVTIAMSSQGALAQDHSHGHGSVGHHGHLTMTSKALIAELQSGGLALIVRHERTDAISSDVRGAAFEDCTQQRNLSLAGIANAVENRVVIDRLEIPIGDVLASPMCRTLDTARYMFGSAEPEDALWGYGGTAEQRSEAFRQVILDHVIPTENRVLVTHLGTFHSLFDVHLSEGDMAIVRSEDGVPTLLGIIPSNLWNDVILDNAHLRQ